MSGDIEFLTAELKKAEDKYEQIGRPLMGNILQIHTQLMNLKREAGLLFYMEYMHYGTLQKDECENLNEAMMSAQATEESGNGFCVRVYGPGVEYINKEWHDWTDTGEE